MPDDVTYRNVYKYTMQENIKPQVLKDFLDHADQYQKPGLPPRQNRNPGKADFEEIVTYMNHLRTLDVRGQLTSKQQVEELMLGDFFWSSKSVLEAKEYYNNEKGDPILDFEKLATFFNKDGNSDISGEELTELAKDETPLKENERVVEITKSFEENYQTALAKLAKDKTTEIAVNTKLE